MSAPNKLLVVFLGGRGYVLMHDADEGINELIENEVGGADCYDIDAAGIEHERVEDGVWIGRLLVEDDGPADGNVDGREVALQLTDLARATPGEWVSFIEGDWPWERKTPWS